MKYSQACTMCIYIDSAVTNHLMYLYNQYVITMYSTIYPIRSTQSVKNLALINVETIAPPGYISLYWSYRNRINIYNSVCAVVALTCMICTSYFVNIEAIKNRNCDKIDKTRSKNLTCKI